MNGPGHQSGPLSGRHVPTTWQELETAVQEGRLNETTWVELKEQLPATQKPTGNRELAEDLASLALHGGLYVAGAGEDARNTAGSLPGVELEPARSRIVAVAANHLDPPLYVEPNVIEQPDRPGHGCLLVTVPATGPHMVNGRYWGRNYDGKQKLTDAEVQTAMTRRQQALDVTLDRVRDLKRNYLERVSTRSVFWQTPRLFLRIVPIGARPECLLPLISQPTGNHRLQELARGLSRDLPGHGQAGQPSPLSELFTWTRHSRGRKSSSQLEQPARLNSTADEALEVVLDEDGPLDVTQGRTYTFASSTYFEDGVERIAVDTDLLLRTVHDALGVAGRLFADTVAYPGPCHMAIRVSDLTGSYDHSLLTRGAVRPRPYEGEPAYEKTTVSTTAELTERPWVVAERLLSRLVRALGVEAIYLPYAPEAP